MVRWNSEEPAGFYQDGRGRGEYLEASSGKRSATIEAALPSRLEIVLFRAIELPLVRGDVADGWEAIGPTTVIDVPGDHTSFFLNPEAQAIVRRSLEAAQDRARLDRGNI